MPTPGEYKIAIIGEAYGEEEEQWKMPFIGSAGKQLDTILEDALIPRSECFLINVFNFRPGTAAQSHAANPNDLGLICGAKSDPDVARGLPPLVPGKYVKTQYLGEVDRLVAELTELQPNVAILLGNTACWALLGQQAISKIRGTACISTRVPGLKCIPTYHPAAVLRQYDLRHVTVLDFIKAKRESQFPELRRPVRTIYVAETIDDIRWFKEKFLDGVKEKVLDIETGFEQITCIGFAPSIDVGFVIPITDPRKPNGNYWPTTEMELEVWKLIAEIVGDPSDHWVGQNGLYDLQYLWQFYSCPVPGYKDDTMLLHHSLQPESEKGLGFLGSVYTNETAWKKERPRGEQTIKKDD
jgi:uracil-DNA glycosylase